MNTNYKNESEIDFEKVLECCSSVDSTHSGYITDDYIGSDCLDFENAGQDNIYPSELDCYEHNDGNMIYNPSELMLRPPSSSDMHFNYNYPAILPPQSRITNNNNAALQSNFCGTPLDMLSTNLPESADTPSYSNNSHLNSGNCHPNMWYPNSSFSSNKSYRSRTTYGGEAPNNQIINMFQLANSSREARNLAEKNRRNKLNSSIQELSTMVPHVAESPRRVDKTAVLRFAAHGLRLQYVFGKSVHKTSTQTTDSLMKLLDSFFLTLTCNGQIVLVSSSIEQHLGHCQTDLYGQNIVNIIHPEDHQIIKEKLIPTDLDNLLDIRPENEIGECIRRTQAEEDAIDCRLRQDKRSFTIRMAKSGPKSEPTIYEVVKIDGSFRRSDMSSRGEKTTIFSPTVHLLRRSRCREEIMPLHTISSNDIVLVAVARVIRPPPINRSFQVNNMEYKTRHLIDGRIIDCDQNISLVAGYMIDEVRNLSPFTFIHQYDVRWVIVALRQMYDCNSSFGESTYRLFTRNGQIIYLHTKGFLEIDKNTNKVHSFICVNTMLNEEEGKRRIQNMKKKFAVIINSKIPESLEDVPASENPQQLEKAVMCLIKNLKSESVANDDFDDDYGDNDIDTTNSDDFASTSFSTKSHHHANPYQKYVNTSPNMGRSTKTPPLDLVPPATDSIKSSITKSVNVVKTTAGKFLRSTGNICAQLQQEIVHDSNECSPNPHTYEYNQLPNDIEDIIYTQNNDNDIYLTTTSDQEVCSAYTSSGAVKRKIPYSAIESDSDEYSVPMQRQAIENVLSNSLQQINNRLNKQLNTAMELREQGQHYEVPDTDERLADIMKEHQRQQEMYNTISNEFEDQRKNSEYSSSGSESLQKCTNNIVDETQQLHNQE